MSNEQYIGKKLSECPDGTVAVVAGPNGMYRVRELSNGATYDYGDDSPSLGGPAALYTVIQILSLGTPRPKTLADEEPGVAWQAGKHGYIRWRLKGVLMACHSDTPGRIFQDANLPGDIKLNEATRLGKITGLRFEGEE